MAERKRRRPGALRAVLLIGVSSLLALLVGELVVRIAGMGPAPHPTSTGKIVRPSADPVLRFEHRPHSARARAFQPRRGDPPRIALYTVNGQGFRGPRVELEKPDGVYRIACVGDSFTFGTGVNDDEAWPAVLQELLTEGRAGTVEVMNCGVGGYNSVQEAVFLEKRVLPFEPDLVIACLYLNDVMVGSELPRAEAPDWVRFLRRWTRPGREGWMQGLRRVSVLTDLVCDRTYYGLESRIYTARHAEVFVAEEKGWQLAREALVRMRELSQARGADFLLLLYPQMIRQGDKLASHDAYAVVKEFARAEGIPLFDLEPAFLEHRIEDFWVHPTDLHPNAAGNRVAARAIADHLLAGGLPAPGD